MITTNRPHRARRRTVRLALASALILGVSTLVAGASSPAQAALSKCGNPGPAPAIQHVMVVMVENSSYGRTIGNFASAPYQNNVLVKQCGLATKMFGATHTSAANYLGLTAGQYPPSSPPGCATASSCATGAQSLFSQLDASGGHWKNYVESMPHPCAGASQLQYKVGHNPAVFYTNLTTCIANDVPVADLSKKSGPLWHDLRTKTLPAFSFVSPNKQHDGDGSSLSATDTFLSHFIPLVTASPAYQDGTTVVIVTYDEGNIGKNQIVGQNCTDQAADLAGTQESCHVPFFVIYPYTAAGTRYSGFATHYSVTRTVEELFHLPLLAGAQTAPTLLGTMGLHT